MVVGLVVWGLVACGVILVALGNRKMPRLAEVTTTPPNAAPSVSCIVAARNEETTIEAGVRSLLAQNYPALELVVVNDRSTDGTGNVLKRLQADFPRLKIIDVTHLPSGWLGKNHALWKGAAESSGEIILFTDADIIMKPHTITSAVAQMQSANLDHLTIMPRVNMKGFISNAVVCYFTFSFSAFFRPWKAPDKKSKSCVGVGAFNMVRRAAYLAAGTHEKIALRPDDDLMLARLLKRAGAHTQCDVADDMVSVEWYPSTWAMIKGLEKNTFAGLEYSITATILSTMAIAMMAVAPFFMPFFTTGAEQMIWGSAALLLLWGHWDNARLHRLPLLASLCVPMSASIFIFIIWNSMARTLWQGGIIWRDTLYPLRELRKNKIA